MCSPRPTNKMYLFYISICISCLLIFIIRILLVIIATNKGWRKPIKRSTQATVKTVIVIGSGGHTSEMMYLMESLSVTRYYPRLYVIASSDTWSYQCVLELEEKRKNEDASSSFEIVNITRSRSVHQSYFTSVFTTLYSTIISIPIMLRFKPDIVLCNGPGTCVPVCIVAFLMRCCFFSNNTIVFIESICRVKSLSLSGRILQWFVDELYVQWPELLLECKRAKYIGRVV